MKPEKIRTNTNEGAATTPEAFRRKLVQAIKVMIYGGKR